jgi:hypothetical protein
MKERNRKNGLLIFVLILTGLGSEHVLAGGLVDTGYEVFSAAGFTAPEMITNPWWSVAPGSKTLYYAESDDECVWTLTEDAGVLLNGFSGDDFSGDYAMTSYRAVLDRSWVDDSEDCDQHSFQEVWDDLGIPAEETTYDWYAQDDEQNVWYMGEDTWDGDSEGSFAAGCDGAEPGILIRGGMPDKGTFHMQEYLEDEAEDWVKVVNYIDIDGVTCMKTKEWSPLEPGAVEHKYYCDGSLVLVEELQGKTLVVEQFDGGFVAPPAPLTGPPYPVPACTND